MRKIESGPYICDVMKEIAKERKRLEKIVASDEYKRKPHLNWMEDWLSKTDEEHYEDDNYWNSPDKNCNVCGKKDKTFISMDFSFCDEYGCGIQICRNCLEKMIKKYDKEVIK